MACRDNVCGCALGRYLLRLQSSIPVARQKTSLEYVSAVFPNPVDEKMARTEINYVNYAVILEFW